MLHSVSPDVGRERPRRAEVDDAVGLQAVDLERDRLAVLAGGRAGDGEALLVELGTAVLGRGAVAPLLDLVLAREVGERVAAESGLVYSISKPPSTTSIDSMSKGTSLGEVELLQAVAQLAVLAPVAAGAEATDDQLAVVALEHAADTGLEALRHPEQRALLGAVDVLEVGALQAAVGDVADEHLAGVRALRRRRRACSGSWRSRSAASTAPAWSPAGRRSDPGVPSFSVVKWL